MSNQSDYFLLLLESYAAHRQKSGTEILKLFEENQLISYIYGMYEQYHIEDMRNAFDDLDKKLGFEPIIL